MHSSLSYCIELFAFPFVSFSRTGTSTLQLTLASLQPPLCLILSIFSFSFSPQAVQADEALWRAALPQVSSSRGGFPRRCGTMLALEGAVGFLPIVSSASRRALELDK